MVANNAETRTYDKWIDSQECKVNNLIFSHQNGKEIKDRNDTSPCEVEVSY